jgi:hypothetical protein
MAYFSEREKGPIPRTIEEITPGAWKGIWAIVMTRLQNGSFGHAFPDQCPDGHAVIGHHPGLFEAAIQGEGIVWPVDPDQVPDTLAVMDLLEFCEEYVAQPVPGSFHSFFTHRHLSFNVEEGKADFRKAVNKVLARNGIAFEIDEDGLMVRLGPAGLAPVLKNAVFKTGDKILDDLLEAAREKFTDPSLDVRKEALEKIWDAFERLKTIEAATDKKASISALLDKAVPEPEVRERVDNEMQELTDIGNKLMIRHSEVGKTPITKSEQVDYFFQRMFSVVRLLLKATGRGG